MLSWYRTKVRGQQSHPYTNTHTQLDIQRHKIVQSFSTDVNEEAFSVFLNFVPNRKRVENSRSIKGEEFLIQSVWWSYCCGISLQDECPSVSLADSVCVSAVLDPAGECGLVLNALGIVWLCQQRPVHLWVSHRCQEQTSNERRERERQRQTGLRGALRVEQDVGLSAAHLLHTAHVHLRVVTVNPETCNTNTVTVANHAQHQ